MHFKRSRFQSFSRNSCPQVALLPPFFSFSTCLRKHPFLLALCCWGRFTPRNVCSSGRNSILTMQINVYIINPVVMGVPNIFLSNFTCLLVDFGKVQCSCTNELQQNSNASSREHYILPILTVLLEILHVYI